MSSAATARPSKSVAVTIIGLLTLLFGVGDAALGGNNIFGGTVMAKRLENDPAGGLGPLLQMIAGFVIVVGVAFLLTGVLGMVAGLGVLGRKPWGRILTFLVAALAALWGLASLSFYDQGTIYIAFGAAHLLFGVAAFVILIPNGNEFSQLRV